MTLVTDLDLPDFDLSDPDLIGEAYHLRLAALRQQSWLARSPSPFLGRRHRWAVGSGPG
jgi:hypothetical protein